jgi:hypothetical protein
MTSKVAAMKTPRRALPAGAPALPLRLGHHAPPTIEQFEGERMGIAAKE